eukprot:scaffold626_cov337-Pavlova_lutheri.AAC.62
MYRVHVRCTRTYDGRLSHLGHGVSFPPTGTSSIPRRTLGGVSFPCSPRRNSFPAGPSWVWILPTGMVPNVSAVRQEAEGRPRQ